MFLHPFFVYPKKYLSNFESKSIKCMKEGILKKLSNEVPIVPFSSITGKMKTLMLLNPVAPIVEIFRFAYLGCGSIPFTSLGISVITTTFVLFISTVFVSPML